MEEFQTRINRLDLGLFSHVTSQSTDEDKRSFLSLQLAARQIAGGFVYLEIGSYMGGSLQPYVIDPLCTKIISIDPRPKALPDVRGTLSYARNTTENMLKGLGKIPGADLKKIITLENGTDVLDPNTIAPRPDLCFIDGEHTDEAVLRDGEFCLRVSKEDGCIAFHDANIVYNGIKKFVEGLRKHGRPFRAFSVSDSVFFVELGNCRFSETAVMRQRLSESYRGYLWSLAASEPYRRFYYSPVFQMLRWLKSKTWNLTMGRFRRGS